jgi:2-haloalkanoic acid dehalogenase type II
MDDRKIKAVFFDFMGTCLDWHTGAVSILPSSIEESTRSDLALRWRQTYFDVNKARIQAQLEPEDIDITLEKALRDTLTNFPQHKALFDDEIIEKCIAQWHSMPAWPEVAQTIKQIQQAGFETFVVANGTTRLQLNLCRSSGLKFDMLFSSHLLGVYKPSPESYQKALELVKLKPEEVVQVAAHISDLRGAKGVGLKTIYIKRWTDDIEEDPEVVRGEVDYFLDDMTRLPEVLTEIDTE